MAIAKSCDRCGVYTVDLIDLCPKCLKELNEWLGQYGKDEYIKTKVKGDDDNE